MGPLLAYVQIAAGVAMPVRIVGTVEVSRTVGKLMVS